MRSFGQTGTVEVWRYACPRLTLFAPSRSRALRKFPDGNFRRPLVKILRALTSAEMAALKGNAAARIGFFLAALHSVAKRVSRGQAYHPTRSVPVCPKDRTARLRRHDPQLRSHLSSHRAVSPRVEKIARPGVLVLAEAWSRALFSQQRQMGTRCACWHAGTVRCGWARLPRVDPLCDRMERGEEEANTGRRDASPITNFADVKARRLPTSDRRKFPSGNFRSARDLEGAERVNPRKARLRPSPSPFANKWGQS